LSDIPILHLSSAQLKVTAGIHYHLKNGDQSNALMQTAGVERIVPHPDKDRNVVLLKLNSQFILSERVSVVCLPKEGE
jgi:hypothetical protein